ncbi:bifunctional RNase H/acid phosphatase [Cellulomonas cellasea]|uniref:Fructose-2,6-bisphosphatase n=2 Tax=Cellulomonas cellasea TaxID=43670 RepID=A0A0A0BBT3_9CELL|nr:bifunctional RNase H/acid phosphatase [Cellulomonas cellasea]KGM03542.1 fructose-2,6-bisphosphatase [Cellulomonas cellasea DSM 20118]GEA89186.1 bifunctional RNase H/acid phosphatase [Cellulomonas cellasea]
MTSTGGAAGSPRRLVVEADGGSRGNPGPAGYGALVRDAATGQVLAERADHLGVTTNNVAEYSGLVAGLEAAAQIDPAALVEVRMDSRLVVEQMSGRWQIKHEDMRRLARRAAEVLPRAQVTYTWVPRAENSAADALANEAMDTRGPVSRDPGPTPDAPSPGLPPAPAPVGEGARARLPRPSGAAVRFDDEQPVTVVLVRHGETTMTVSRGYSGSSEPGPSLNDHGRAQAAAAAELVRRVGRDLWGDIPYPTELLASPMVRTQETAAVVARRLGLPVGTEPAFREADFGAWQGLTAEQIEERWPGMLVPWHTEADVRPPGGESIEDVGRRIRGGLDALLAGGVDRTVVVVSHAVAIRAALGVAMRAQPSAWSQLRVAPASVSIVRLFEDGRTEVAVAGAPSEGWAPAR